MENNIQPFIAVVRPSRGLIFAEVEEYFEQVRDTYPNMRTFRSHDLPLPECYNFLTKQALQDPKYEYFWFNEDDTVPEPKTLDRFLEAMGEYDIAAQNYGFNGNWGTVARSAVDNKILFTGFGNTFMKREVLESFDKPIFKADRTFNISNLQWQPVDPHKIYGAFDIVFGSEARKKGWKFTQITGESRHLQLIELGEKEKNAGVHIIGEKGKVEKELILQLTDL